jgi:outer membrane protein OmpA-like peptidoglycan-associated protein
MRHRDFLPGISDPDMRVSGEQLLNILGRVLASPEETQERMAERIRADLDKMGISGTAVRITGAGIVISLNNIQFPPDSGELVETEKEKIRKIAIILNEYPNRRLLVGGHTALRGTVESQMLTSVERAQSVANFLIALGCRGPEEIQTQGYGGTQPIAEGDSPEALALNRRAEVTLLK